MGYTNSPLVDVTMLSPNFTEGRVVDGVDHKITKITIHHAACKMSAEALGNCFKPTSRQASSNYGIGYDGKIGLYVEEKNRSWCSSNRLNDSQAITIEVSNSQRGGDWPVSEASYEALIALCADICKRNGIDKLVYDGTPNGSLTRHNMFASTQCPGPYLQARFPDIANRVNALLGAEKPAESRPEPEKPYYTLDVSKFKTNTPAETVDMIGPTFTADMKKTGILASVSMAQLILESGWGKGELAQKALNFFSMKSTVSGNSWEGSVWKGKTYKLLTSEWNGSEYVKGYADFRAYDSISESIEDHSMYLRNAMKGSQKRYNGLIGEKNYKRAAEIIKAGGYATDPQYVSKLCRIIETYNLSKYDIIDEPAQNPPTKPLEPEKPTDSVNIQVGDLVRITGTHWSTGKVIPNWVKKQNWYVDSFKFDNIVILNKNESKNPAIAIKSPIFTNDIEVVKKNQTLSKGDAVKIRKGCKVYGKDYTFDDWVYDAKLYVRLIREDYVVVSIYKFGQVTGAVHIDDIIKL